MSAPDFLRWLDGRNWPWQVHVSLVLIVLGLFRNQVWQWYRQRVGARCPPTPGQVKSVSVTQRGQESAAFIRIGGLGFQTGETASFRAEIRYSYTAAGEVQEGIYTREFETEEEAGEFVKRLWGRPITARVNPKTPNESMVLEKDVEDLLESRLEPE